ncbi:MAG: CsbD family protein [Acidobacteriota bacterium]
MINKEEAAGKVEKAKGVVKEKVGQMTGDPELQDEGVADQASGAVREAVGTTKRKVEQVVDALKK